MSLSSDKTLLLASLTTYNEDEQGRVISGKSENKGDDDAKKAVMRDAEGRVLTKEALEAFQKREKKKGVVRYPAHT